MFGTLTPYVDDTLHQAEPHPQSGFIIVMDPTGLFLRGLSFDQFDFAMSLYYGVWPVGMVVRDLSDNWRYRVVNDYRIVPGESYYRKALLSICGTVLLTVANNNGVINRKEN